jgi:hypothetical protein
MRKEQPNKGCDHFWRIAVGLFFFALTGCGIRPGILCSSDGECAGGVCINGLCVAKDAGAPVAESCDAGSAPCVAAFDGGCWQGSRVCDNGVLQGCVPLSPSADLSSCGPACEPCGSSGDRCERGLCKCGTNPSCSPGQRCSGSLCICDPASCPAGCCDGQVCLARSTIACGIGGAKCKACDLVKADRCSGSGQCACGSGALCGPGQRCSAGVCICDAVSCPSGCCNGSVCSQPSDLTCGTGGAACKACVAGQRCNGSACVCDGASCPNGCCDGTKCQHTFDKCGSSGGGCLTCDLVTADSCSSTGQCACGTGPACSGLHCVSGHCVCDGLVCGGCCSVDSRCFNSDRSHCGINGASCEVCLARERCSADGACVCASPPCTL